MRPTVPELSGRDRLAVVLWVDREFVHAVVFVEPRRSQLISHAEVQRQIWRDLPVVLHEEHVAPEELVAQYLRTLGGIVQPPQHEVGQADPAELAVEVKYAASVLRTHDVRPVIANVRPDLNAVIAADHGEVVHPLIGPRVLNVGLEARPAQAYEG